MIERIRNIIKRLSFRQVMVGLVLAAIFLVIISVTIPTAVRQLFTPAGDSSGLTSDAQETEDDEHEDVSLELNHTFLLREAIPFVSDRFTVTYNHVEDYFEVIINPMFDTTEADVRAWFDSFADVPEVYTPNIAFIDNWATGAPAQ